MEAPIILSSFFEKKLNQTVIFKSFHILRIRARDMLSGKGSSNPSER